MSNVKKTLTSVYFPDLEKNWKALFGDESSIFDLKPLLANTFKDLLRDNATDLWDKTEECIVAPSKALENELLEVLCKPDSEFLTQALWVGDDSSELEQLLVSFSKDNPSHPLALHVDKSLRGYLPLVIEREEATIAEAYAAEEESYRQDYGRDDDAH
tara:strand:+ start:753 stop:1226 length:474 start_codon:yes stop_codon:yes gene_type:complete